MDKNITIEDILDGFSPYFDLSEKHVKGLESNLVWTRDGYRGLTKTAILGILAQHNKRTSFFLYYLLQALKHRAQFCQLGHNLQMTVALRPSELENNNFYKAITQVFSETGATAKGITLELPPTLFDDFYSRLGTIGQLIDFGFRIAINDFYSDPKGLTDVSRSLIHEIRTPPALGREITYNETARKNLEKLLSHSRENNWQCIVDGIDNRESLKTASAIGAKVIKGGYLGENLSSSQTHDLIQVLPAMRKR